MCSDIENPQFLDENGKEPSAEGRMKLALPPDCMTYPIRYTMHVNAPGPEKDGKGACLLNGETSPGTPLVLSTLPHDSSTFILGSFEDGHYVIIDERTSGVLQIENGSDAPRAPIVLAEYQKDTDHQLWRFEQTDQGSYYLVSKKNGMVLDLCGLRIEDGSPFIAFPRNNGWNQQFHFESIGSLKTDLTTVLDDDIDPSSFDSLCTADQGGSDPLNFFDLFQTIKPVLSLSQTTISQTQGSAICDLRQDKASYEPFLGDAATLVLLSQECERLEVRCKRVTSLIPERMREKTINYLVLTDFLSEGVEPSRFIYDLLDPNDDEDPYICNLSSFFDMVSISRLSKESLKKLPDGTSRKKAPAFEGYFLTYNQENTKLSQETIMRGIFKDLETWGYDHKTKTPLTFDLVVFITKSHPDASGMQYIDMGEIPHARPGELRANYDHMRCLAMRLDMDMMNDTDNNGRCTLPTRGASFRFDPLFGFATSYERDGFRRFSRADYITKRKLVRAWSYLVRLEEIVGNQTFAPVFFHEFSHAIEFTLNGEANDEPANTFFNPEKTEEELVSLGINHQQFAMRVVLNGAYENMLISNSNLLTHLKKDYKYLHERLDTFWSSWGKTY